MIHTILLATILAVTGAPSSAPDSAAPSAKKALASASTNAASASTPSKRKSAAKKIQAQIDSLLRADSLTIDSLRRATIQFDSLVHHGDTLLARSRDSIARLQAANEQAGMLHVADTLHNRKLLDSIALFHRIDTLSLHIDTFKISDADLSSDSARLRDLILHAASASGYTIVDHPLVPDVINSQPLRIWLTRTHDSAWLKLDLGGKVAKDSIHLRAANMPRIRDANAIPHMERDAVRKLFGKESIPPEPKGPWHWAVRVAIVASVAIASAIAMVSLQ